MSIFRFCSVVVCAHDMLCSFEVASKLGDDDGHYEKGFGGGFFSSQRKRRVGRLWKPGETSTKACGKEGRFETARQIEASRGCCRGEVVRSEMKG